MKITPEVLQAIAPAAKHSDTVRFAPHLEAAMEQYDITTLSRAAMFLAQVMHESGALQYLEEIASGKEYENRKDLGNIHTGDGPRYKGRGLIQITGRNNYAQISADTGIDFVNVPKLLEQDEYAAMSAGWFWNKHHLNELADKGDFIGVTKVINGGTNGLADRQKYYERAKAAVS